jgi:hypothetical protein
MNAEIEGYSVIALASDRLSHCQYSGYIFRDMISLMITIKLLQSPTQDRAHALAAL